MKTFQEFVTEISMAATNRYRKAADKSGEAASRAGDQKTVSKRFKGLDRADHKLGVQDDDMDRAVPHGYSLKQKSENIHDVYKGNEHIGRVIAHGGQFSGQHTGEVRNPEAHAYSYSQYHHGKTHTSHADALHHVIDTHNNNVRERKAADKRHAEWIKSTGAKQGEAKHAGFSHKPQAWHSFKNAQASSLNGGNTGRY